MTPTATRLATPMALLKSLASLLAIESVAATK
jgi:hypothetical protein